VHEDGDELDPAALEQMEALAAAAALGDDTPSASVLNLLACGALDKLPDVKVGSLQQSLKPACDSKTLQELRLKQFLKADVPQEVLIEEFKSDSESEPAGDEGDVLGEIERPEPAGARADWIANNAEAESDADLLAMAPADLLPFLKVFQERSPDVALDPLPATKAAVKVLQHVIDEKKLNKKQSLMFLLFGRQLFAEHFGADFTLIAPDVDHTDARGQSLHGAASRRSNDAQPVHAFLAGAAGTGKSRVIESLQFLAGLIGKSSSVLVTAMTGAAAVNVRGATVHGALHLMSDVEVVPSKLQGKLSMVSLVIIDECSMMDCTMFEKLNTRLQQGRTAGVVFGGVSIMFVGDFCQLQPVAGGGSLMSNAAVLWREHVTTVVMLDEQMRQADDIAMAHHLTAFRSGAVTQADIQYFNQKLVTNAGDVVRENLLQTLGLAPRLPGSLLGDHAAAAASSSTALQAAAAQPQVPAADDITHYRSFFPIVVADNKERTDINTAIAKNLFMRMGMNSERAFICISALYVVSHLVDADPHDPHHVDDGRDKKKKKKRVSELETKPNLIKILRTQALTVMDHQLRLFIGMEVIVTTNICVEYGIANGSHAYVTAIQLSEEAKPPTIDEFGMKQYSIADIGRVILRLLRPDGEPSVVQMESDLGPGEFAVYEDKEYIKFKPKTKKLLQMRKLGAWARKTHKILQLSIVPAFTMTAWKLQGLTLKKLVVASTLNRQNRNIAPRYLYVVLSRLKSLEGLILLQPLPQNPSHTAYKLGKDLIGETKRLQDLEAQTAYRARELMKLFRVHVHGGSGSAAVPSPPVAAASAAAARPLTALELAYARISGRHL
jgi:hypothetical protein